MTIIFRLDNAISGLDFNPSGTLIASMDRSGICLISDVSTDEYSFHSKMGGRESNLLNSIRLIIAAYLFLYKLKIFVFHIKVFTIFV